MLLFWSNNGFTKTHPFEPVFNLFFHPFLSTFPFLFQYKKASQTSPRNFNFSPTQPWGLWRPSWVSKRNNGGPEGFAHVNSNSIHLFKSQLPFLKLTWPLKIDGLEDEISFLGWRVKKKNRLPKNRRGFKFLFRFFFLGGMYMTQIAIDSHFRRIFIGTLFQVMFLYIAANGFPCAVVGSEIQRANNF